MSEKHVELRGARIPIVGNFAAHYWLVIHTLENIDRWEVWQFRHCCQWSWGHLHRNLMPHDQGVGNGPSWIEYTWSGKEADLLLNTILSTPESYPYKYQYLYWPGPNSNTYVQWVLNQAGTNYFLGGLALGKNYR